MTNNTFGWHYPPGAERDPRAPWNEPEADPDGCDTGWDDHGGPDRAERED